MNYHYYKKYLKYKSKYLSVKNQNGGMYSEAKRGNINFLKYPPCYNLSSSAKTIFDILENKNLVTKYSSLLDNFSIILCQLFYQKNKDCKDTMLDERLEELKNVKISLESKKIVAENLLLKSKVIVDFLHKITTKIMIELEKLIKDKKLDEKTKIKINDLTKTFFSEHYNELSKNCS